MRSHTSIYIYIYIDIYDCEGRQIDRRLDIYLFIFKWQKKWNETIFIYFSLYLLSTQRAATSASPLAEAGCGEGRSRGRGRSCRTHFSHFPPPRAAHTNNNKKETTLCEKQKKKKTKPTEQHSQKIKNFTYNFLANVWQKERATYR